MKKTWSPNWNRSVKPRKQRKYAAKAPLHIRSVSLVSHLSKELREKHKYRSIRVKVGDKIKVLTGSLKGKTGKVERVDTVRKNIFITGFETVKKDGSKALVPIHPSNLLITDLDTSDKRRLEVRK